MNIGFIGLGNLGTPIAENLLQKGHRMLVYNRTASKAQPLADKGATIATSVKEVAAGSDIVFTMVSDDAALNHLTLNEEGIAANLKAGGIHVSMSTILPATSTYLAGIHQQYNNHYLAAPVLGRPEAAKARKLNFLMSGDAAVIGLVKPLLTDGGAANIWEFGAETGAANVAKLCSNFLIVSAMEAMAEAINLANKSGVDATAWHSMVTQTLFTSPIYINYGNALLKEAFAPGGFALRLGLKDVNLMLQQAQTAEAAMPTAELVKKQFDTCMEKGLSENDWTAIALALK
ncbi:MAG TPA: NAD(P)-dependent oxidoreductase [Chitinophagaceae bacterium]|nr:NAD(P)-dependent oxidoreductase [Chitinophagaceae bacterium]